MPTNNKKKILVVVGARPNFIKVAPLFWEFKKHRNFLPVLVHTGQHYDYEMSQIFFQDLEIPRPDYNLGVGSAAHAIQTAKIMVKLEKVFLKERPDAVAVVGDVNSTLAGALVAAKMHIPIVHIEAGPRTYNRAMPEEINRLVADHVSDILFCAVRSSFENLRREGLAKRAYNVGDLMYDAFLRGMKLAKRSTILQKLELAKKTYLLLTLHRPQNVDDPVCLERMLDALGSCGQNIIFPVHPRTRAALKKVRAKKFLNITFIDPVGYVGMIGLEMAAKKIVTDSGGMQKEAYWLKVPCITLLEEKCWPETVAAGWNVLVGNNEIKIKKAIAGFNPAKPAGKEFGDGHAASKIIKIMEKKLNGKFKKKDLC
jgi:UDP-N-acetylglucosamine 2-epimerase